MGVTPMVLARGVTTTDAARNTNKSRPIDSRTRLVCSSGILPRSSFSAPPISNSLRSWSASLLNGSWGNSGIDGRSAIFVGISRVSGSEERCINDESRTSIDGKSVIFVGISRVSGSEEICINDESSLYMMMDGFDKNEYAREMSGGGTVRRPMRRCMFLAENDGSLFFRMLGYSRFYL